MLRWYDGKARSLPQQPSYHCMAHLMRSMGKASSAGSPRQVASMSPAVVVNPAKVATGPRSMTRVPSTAIARTQKRRAHVLPLPVRPRTGQARPRFILTAPASAPTQVLDQLHNAKSMRMLEMDNVVPLRALRLHRLQRKAVQHAQNVAPKAILPVTALLPRPLPRVLM